MTSGREWCNVNKILMIHRLSSNTIPGIAAVFVAAAVLSLPCPGQDTGRKIEELLARGDEAYMDDKVDEAVALYREAHDMLSLQRVPASLKTAVDERYKKSLALSRRPHVGAVAASTAAGTSLAASPARSGTEIKAIALRDDKTQDAMSALERARELYREGKYEEAQKEYQNAYDLMPDIPLNEKRRKFIAVSLADASVAVAQEYARVGRYDEARDLLNKALEVDPVNKYAEATLTKLDDPVRNNPAKTPAHVANVREVERLLQLGYGYYDLGKFDDATRSFEAVLRIDNTNTAARRGMEATARRLEKYYDAARDQARGAALNEVAAAWEKKPIFDDLPEGMGEGGNIILDPAVALERKLTSMIIPRIDFEGVDILEAVDFLRKQAESLDANRITAERGVNITVSLGDPESQDARDVLARRFNLQLTDVPMRDALEYIARATGTSLQITSYSAQFSSMSDTAPFVSRVIAVPPGFFSVASGGGDSSAASVDPFGDAAGSDGGFSLKRVDPRTALKEMGVPFPEGSSVRYNSQNATLFVFNAPQNIRLIEDLVAAKATEQPLQVVVSATLVDVSEETLEELGFDWIVNFNMDMGKWYGAGPEEATGNSRPPNIPGMPLPGAGLATAGLRTTTQVMTTDTIDSLIRSGITGNFDGYVPGTAPGVFSVRGIWSQADIAVIMRGLDQKKGVDVLQKPQVIVRPGEKATFYAGKEFIYPEEYEPPQIPTGSTSNSSNNSMIVAPANPGSFTKKDLGTTFDVDVTGIDEGKTSVNLVITPKIIEFDGFINYGSPITSPIIGSSLDEQYITRLELTKNEILQPIFSRTEATTSLNLETGKTVVFASFKKSQTMEFEDKVPFFGDLPLIGRLFRSQGKQEQRRALIMFVRADIIDPAGRDILTHVAPSSMGSLPEAGGSGLENPEAQDAQLLQDGAVETIEAAETGIPDASDLPEMDS